MSTSNNTQSPHQRSGLQRAVTTAPAAAAQDAQEQPVAQPEEPVSRVGRTLEDMLKTP